MCREDLLRHSDDIPVRMQFGQGRISGAVGIVFGSISLGGVLCFLFPDLLTTPEFRAQYDITAMRHVLAACMFVAFGCSIRSLITHARARAGLWGAGLTSLGLLLGGPGAETGMIDGSSVYISLDYLLLSLVAMALVFVPLELFLPQRRRQTRFHSEWRTDLVYFVVAHLFVQGLAVLSQKPVTILFSGVQLASLQAWIAQLPYWAQLFLAIFVADLFQYAVHRIFHAVPYLWRFHAVHHSTRTMDWLAGSRLHLVDVIGTRMMVFLPLFLLGFTLEVLYGYVAIVATHAVLNHTNTRLPFGPLEYLVVSPRIHHWHHSVERSAHDKNFAVHFPWIDRIFGSYHAPAGEWPSEVGLEDISFPNGYLKQFFYPFFNSPGSSSSGGEPSSR